MRRGAPKKSNSECGQHLCVWATKNNYNFLKDVSKIQRKNISTVFNDIVEKYKADHPIMSIFDDRRVELAQLSEQNDEDCNIYIEKLRVSIDKATGMIKAHLDLIVEENRVETEKETRSYLRMVSDKCNLELGEVENIYENYRDELRAQFRRYKKDEKSFF